MTQKYDTKLRGPIYDFLFGDHKGHPKLKGVAQLVKLISQRPEGDKDDDRRNLRDEKILHAYFSQLFRLEKPCSQNLQSALISGLKLNGNLTQELNKAVQRHNQATQKQRVSTEREDIGGKVAAIHRRQSQARAICIVNQTPFDIEDDSREDDEAKYQEAFSVLACKSLKTFAESLSMGAPYYYLYLTTTHHEAIDYLTQGYLRRLKALWGMQEKEAKDTLKAWIEDGRLCFVDVEPFPLLTFPYVVFDSEEPRKRTAYMILPSDPVRALRIPSNKVNEICHYLIRPVIDVLATWPASRTDATGKTTTSREKITFKIFSWAELEERLRHSSPTELSS